MEGQLQNNGCLKMGFALFGTLFGDCLWGIVSNCQFGNVIGTGSRMDLLNIVKLSLGIISV